MNNTNRVKVSIIIPTHNRPLMLKRAIDSVLLQTYQNFELLVVSDASTKKTDLTVRGFKNNKIIYIKHKKNKGSAAARNTGIKNAKGEYLAFLDDDDEWLPQKLEKQVHRLDRLPSDYGLVYCWMKYFKANKPVGVKKPTLKGYIFKNMLSEQAIGSCSTILIKKKIIKNTGMFNENYSRGDDGDFIRKIAKSYKIDYIEKILIKYHRGHKDRLSLNTKININSIIKEMKERLKNFESDFNKYPDQKSIVLTKLAGHHLLLLRFNKWLYYSLAAYKICPTKSIINKLKFQIKVYTNNIKRF